MSIDTSLHALARLVEAQSEDGVNVESVSATTEGEELSTTMRVSLPFDLSTGAKTVDVANTEYRDGRVCVDVSMMFDTAELPEIVPEQSETDDRSSDDTQSDRPPAYKDPDQLRDVYEEYDSFAKMTDALDVDVTAQTVRRNMMKHGIHEPNTSSDETESDDDAAAETPASDETKSDDDADAESPASDETKSSEDSRAEATPIARADDETPEFEGVTLPDGITPEAVRDAVAESSSLHGVQLALDLEMRETRQLLQDLGVLTYVTGRLSNRENKPDPSEIEQQIYDSLAAHADGGSKN